MISPYAPHKPREKGVTAITDVGKKEEDPTFTQELWIRETCCALDTSLIHALTAAVDQNSLIFEAPTSQSQAQLINLLGANV